MRLKSSWDRDHPVAFSMIVSTIAGAYVTYKLHIGHPEWIGLLTLMVMWCVTTAILWFVFGPFSKWMDKILRIERGDSNG